MKQVKKVSLLEKFRGLHGVWDPHIAAALNDQQVKLVRCAGPGDPLKHEADVLYLVFRGELLIVFKDKKIELGPGDFIVIPREVTCKLASIYGAEGC